MAIDPAPHLGQVPCSVPPKCQSSVLGIPGHQSPGSVIELCGPEVRLQSWIAEFTGREHLLGCGGMIGPSHPWRCKDRGLCLKCAIGSVQKTRRKLINDLLDLSRRATAAGLPAPLYCLGLIFTLPTSIAGRVSWTLQDRIDYGLFKSAVKAALKMPAWKGLKTGQISVFHNWKSESPPDHHPQLHVVVPGVAFQGGKLVVLPYLDIDVLRSRCAQFLGRRLDVEEVDDQALAKVQMIPMTDLTGNEKGTTPFLRYLLHPPIKQLHEGVLEQMRPRENPRRRGAVKCWSPEGRDAEEKRLLEPGVADILSIRPRFKKITRGGFLYGY